MNWLPLLFWHPLIERPPNQRVSPFGFSQYAVALFRNDRPENRAGLFCHWNHRRGWFRQAVALAFYLSHSKRFVPKQTMPHCDKLLSPTLWATWWDIQIPCIWNKIHFVTSLNMNWHFQHEICWPDSLWLTKIRQCAIQWHQFVCNYIEIIFGESSRCIFF